MPAWSEYNVLAKKPAATHLQLYSPYTVAHRLLLHHHPSTPSHSTCLSPQGLSILSRQQQPGYILPFLYVLQ
jgi:hypothetical protein